MTALKDLFKSERGLFALAIVFASTLLCALGRMSVDAWQEMTLYVFGIYATGKTVSSVVAVTKGAAQTEPAPKPTKLPEASEPTLKPNKAKVAKVDAPAKP